jgi:hypothetical protein
MTYYGPPTIFTPFVAGISGAGGNYGWLWSQPNDAEVAVMSQRPRLDANDHDLQKRLQLATLISRFASDGLAGAFGDPRKISRMTRDAAITFLGLLPFDRELPQIAPDDDASLLMVWQTPAGPLFAYVDAWRVDMVEQAGTGNAKYIDNLPFKGFAIPEPLLGLIPKR